MGVRPGVEKTDGETVGGKEREGDRGIWREREIEGERKRGRKRERGQRRRENK